jgi:hypothetical protein
MRMQNFTWIGCIPCGQNVNNINKIVLKLKRNPHWMDLGQRQENFSLSNQKLRVCCWAGKRPIILCQCGNHGHLSKACDSVSVRQIVLLPDADKFNKICYKCWRFIYFTFKWPCIVTSFVKNKQLDASNIKNCHKTLHVSGIFCAHHQE